MATETVSSDHSAKPEQVEKEVPKEVKTMEESILPPKEIEEKTKEEDASIATAASLAETQKKVKETEIEPATVEEVVKVVEEDKPKAEESPSLAVYSAGSEEKIEDKEIEPPKTTEELKKSDDIPAEDVSSTKKPELLKDSVPLEEKIEVPAVDDHIKSEPEKKPEIKGKLQEESTKDVVMEKVEEQPKKIEVPESATEVLQQKQELAAALPEKTEIPESAAEAIEKKVEQTEELPKKIVIPESVSEAIETKEKAEELPPKEIPESVSEAAETKEKEEKFPPKEPEAALVKDVEISAAERKIEAASEPLPGAEDKPEEKHEITEQIQKESVVAEPTRKMETGKTKDEEIKRNKLMELLANESSDLVPSATEEADVEKKDMEVPPIEFTKKTSIEDEEKELATKTDKALMKEEERFVKENEVKDANAEVKPEKTGVTEELTHPESKAVEDVASSTAQDSKKVTEVEKLSRDIELPADNENKKDETVTSVETKKDVEVEKLDVEEPQKNETETKGDEAVGAIESKPEQEKQVEETAKSDAPIQDTPKDEAPVKTAQKHSNNILSKVKHSLVKAKKAITGKSPSRPASSEAKDEVKSK